MTDDHKMGTAECFYTGKPVDTPRDDVDVSISAEAVIEELVRGDGGRL